MSVCAEAPDLSSTNTTSDGSASRLPGNERVTLVSRFSSSSVAVFWFCSNVDD